MFIGCMKPSFNNYFLWCTKAHEEFIRFQFFQMKTPDKNTYSQIYVLFFNIHTFKLGFYLNSNNKGFQLLSCIFKISLSLYPEI